MKLISIITLKYKALSDRQQPYHYMVVEWLESLRCRLLHNDRNLTLPLQCKGLYISVLVFYYPLKCQCCELLRNRLCYTAPLFYVSYCNNARFLLNFHKFSSEADSLMDSRSRFSSEYESRINLRLSFISLRCLTPNSSLLGFSIVDRHTVLLIACSIWFKTWSHLLGLLHSFAIIGVITRLKRSTWPFARGVFTATRVC